MLLIRTRRLHPFALFGLLLLAVCSMISWLWLSRVSDRVLASLERQTGLSFTEKLVSFDPWQRRLSVSDIQIRAEGIQLSAQQISIVLNYQHGWGVWLGEKVESFSAIALDNAHIAVDPELVTFALPNWFQRLSINSGRLSITGIESSLPFDQLTLEKDGQSRLRLYFDNHSEKTAAEYWRFSGAYEVSQGILSGELSLEELPLSDLLKVGRDYLMINKERFTGDSLSGTVNARLSLAWDKHRGLVLNGHAEGQNGQLLLPGISALWQQWQMDSMQFNANDPAQSSAGLSISGLDLKLADVPINTLSFSTTQLRPILPFTITSLAINNSRLVLEHERGASPWLFENLNGSLVLDNKTIKDSWQYQANASLAHVGEFQLSGKLSGSDNEYTFKLDDARLAGPLKNYAAFDGYNMQGTGFNLSYNSQSHNGLVDIVNWQYKKLPNDSSHSASIDLLKALLTDKSGRATIRFAIKPGQSTAPLSRRIYQAVEQRLLAIAQAPFDYLSLTTGYALEPVLRHKAGKAALTPSSYANLEHIHKALAQRPELNLLIDVGVSESRDWPELARYQLEAALQELYPATSTVNKSGKSPMPPGLRAQLLERMYLATQHLKIPEVGEQSPGQRVQEAESWLLQNWPKTPDQIAGLQQARYDFLKNEAGRIGIDGKRIQLRLTSDSGRKQNEPDSVLILQ